ncbi:uncharacterized protein LOC131244041 [Magnolia sinica]|uniref:uncharacterized protein LOC131244041 n=1 Tax=Magnolia sinica TaxID=86752 RepID=UPI00265B2F9C|nr:uncharacterized protein LOC131244041 [Magnolia sinica]
MSLQKAPPTQPIRHPILRVPAHLRRAHPHAFEPQTLSLGPIHQDDEWKDSFTFKSNSIFASLSRPDSAFKPDELWSCITKHLLERESITTILSKIKEAQNKEITVVRDVLFLVSCFLTDLHTNREMLRSKYGVAAINDIVKLDNQLLLELVRAVVVELPSVLKATGPEKSENSNTNEVSTSEPETFRVGFSEDDIPRVIQSFCQFYSPFPQPNSASLEWGKKKTLLDCLHTTISGDFESTEAETSTARFEIAERDCPTAKEVVRLGIRFEPEGVPNISEIRFENGAVRLPALVLKELTETVIRNLMVLEASSKEKPVSDYIRFLNRMLESGDDVAVLRKAGVLKGYLGKDEKVVEFLKSLDDFHFLHGCYVHPVQKALEDLQTHYDEKMKIKEAQVNRLAENIEKKEWNVERLVKHVEKKEELVDCLVENIEKNEGHVNHLVENIEKNERHVNCLAENIEKKERYVHCLAENIEKKERHVDRLVENIEKNEGYVNRLAENIERNERHVDLLAENIEKKEERVNCLVENIEKKEGHVNCLAEKIEKKEMHVDHLAENIEKKEGHVNRLVENIEKKEGHLAENIEKKESHVDRLAENIEKKEEHVGHLAENIEKKEVYVGSLAENIEKKEVHVNRLAENIEKNDRHVNHLAENIDHLAENIEKKHGRVNHLAENIEKKVGNVNRWAVSTIALVATGLLLRLRFVPRK